MYKGWDFLKDEDMIKHLQERFGLSPVKASVIFFKLQEHFTKKSIISETFSQESGSKWNMDVVKTVFVPRKKFVTLDVLVKTMRLLKVDKNWQKELQS